MPFHIAFNHPKFDKEIPKKALTLALAFCTLLVASTNVLADKSDSQYVKVIQASALSAYPTTTIGKAFAAHFDEGQWSSFIAENGARIVQFKGKVSRQGHEIAVRKMLAEYLKISEDEAVEMLKKDPDMKKRMDEQLWQNGAPVTVQWSFTVDGRSFLTTAMVSVAWEGITRQEVLEVIFR